MLSRLNRNKWWQACRRIDNDRISGFWIINLLLIITTTLASRRWRANEPNTINTLCLRRRLVKNIMILPVTEGCLSLPTPPSSTHPWNTCLYLEGSWRVIAEVEKLQFTASVSWKFLSKCPRLQILLFQSLNLLFLASQPPSILPQSLSSPNPSESSVL